MKKLIGVLLMLPAISANALTVDSMVKFADDKGNETFIINNNSAEKMYITSSIKKITSFRDNKPIYELYSRENIADWELSASKTKLVLNPHESTTVGMRSLCNGSCASDQDQYYAVSFLPTYYDNSDEANSKRAEVGFVYGYEPLYVMPAKVSEMKYDISYNDDRITINNKGNTVSRVIVNQCSSPSETQCKSAFTVVAGMQKSFKLSQKTGASEYLNIDIINHDASYFNSVTIKKNKPFSVG